MLKTKDFNPVKQAGENIKTSFIDFLFDASSPSPINVQLKMNTTVNAIGNIVAGNQNIETANSKTGFITNITLANPCVVTSKNHGLLTGDQISPQEIIGTTELNGNNYTITFLTTDTFALDVDSTLFTPYISGGFWEQTLQEYFTLSADYAWHRFFATAFGQYLGLILTYSNDQMFEMNTHRQNFVLNAIKIWYRPGGRNIFGK